MQSSSARKLLALPGFSRLQGLHIVPRKKTHDIQETDGLITVAHYLLYTAGAPVLRTLEIGDGVDVNQGGLIVNACSETGGLPDLKRLRLECRSALRIGSCLCGWRAGRSHGH
jgi:hypothetical protein